MYYTLGTPADTKPIQPKLVPIEITFSPQLCMRTPKHIGKVDPDIEPVQFRIQQSSTENLGRLYFSDQLDPTSTNLVTPIMPLDYISSIDALLSQDNYVNLVGIETRRTDSELQQIDEQKYTDLIKNHTDAGDPLISSKIDLQRILFRTATTLTPEEDDMPNMLRPKIGEQHDTTVHANAMKSYFLPL